MNPLLLVRGLGAAALVLSLAACGGGSTESTPTVSGTTASTGASTASASPAASSVSWAP